MPNPATVSDVEDRWRPLTEQESRNAEVFLDDAWWLLTGRRQSLEANLTAGTISDGNVIRVLVSMVLRVLKNPDGWQSEAVDDWSGRRSDLVASGLLTVTPDELMDVTPRTTGRRNSVRLVIYGDA